MGPRRPEAMHLEREHCGAGRSLRPRAGGDPARGVVLVHGSVRPARAAHMRDLGLDNTLEVCMAKLFGAQMAQRVTDWAVQVHGGYGFSGDFDVERYYRDARILGLYEGTNEIQKLIIADHTLGPTTKT